MKRRRVPVRKVPRIPKSRRVDVTREEFDRVIDLLNRRGAILNHLQTEQDIQLKRIAQIQIELDRVMRTIATLSGSVNKP